MDSVILKLDIIEALALFQFIDSDTKENVFPEIRRIEGDLRAFLYERLSIEEMENPLLLYSKLRSGDRGVV